MKTLLSLFGACTFFVFGSAYAATTPKTVTSTVNVGGKNYSVTYSQGMCRAGFVMINSSCYSATASTTQTYANQALANSIRPYTPTPAPTVYKSPFVNNAPSFVNLKAAQTYYSTGGSVNRF